ncbi:MAG: M48 family metallopeptidase [Clostridia bacterium]|nr:M48 family metallopeptidase [Clostridia bacterium]
MIVPDLIERSKRKTLSLSVMKDGAIIVKAPLSMQESVINKFIEEKQNWIKEKLAIVNKTNNKFEDVIKYKSFLLYGNKYSLVLGDVKKIETNDNFQIVMPRNIEQDKVLKQLKAWYKKVAKKILQDRLKFVEERIRLKSNSMRINDSKGRWGSCNTRGVISFNWRVILLPPQIIDYVIVHELCHLVEMNHSKKFWELVQRFLPSFANSKKAIKEYGILLSLYRDK